MSDVLDKISGLSPAKQKLLLERLKQRREAQRPAEEALEPSPARARGEPLPLSFAQERLWFLHGLAPESPAYHIPAVVRLAGHLVPAAFRQTLGHVVRRHENLRSRFPAEDGQPRLEISPAGRFRLSRVDLSRLAAADRATEARHRLATLTRRPFDLARGPVLRATLVRETPEAHRLALVLHHIVSDGWSRGILVREVAALYDAFLGGRPAELPEPALQYADFAHWQRRWLSGERLEGLLDHWSRRLDGAPPVLDLPTDRPPPSRPSGRGRRRGFALSCELGSALGDLARDRETTLFTVVAAAFAAFLGRHANQDDVVLGTPVAGRDRAEVEDLVGLFVNTLALRLRLDGEPTGRELVARAHETVQDAFAHRELPFERLVAHLEPDRGSGRPPVFQAMVVLQNVPSADATLPGLELTLEETRVTTAKLDLTLHLTERPDGALAASLEYATDLFDATTVARLAERFPRFLEGLVRTPDRPVGDLPLASPGERHQLLREWGGPFPAAGSEDTLVDRFLAQADATPDRLAVVDGPLQVTYGTLRDHACRLATRLGAQGVGPEHRVALRFERSTELVTAILGILLRGAAYVPLDPGHPEERQRYVTDDAGVVATIDALDVAAVSSSPTSPTPEPRGARVPGNSRQAAYVIYTSGSTGRPKGVVVTHANAVRLFSAVVSPGGFDFTGDDVWTLFHSPAFDFSVWEIWGPLLSGGRLVVVPRRTSRSPDALVDLLARERVTVLSQTPSAFRQLQTEDARRETFELATLRWVVFGGEALEPTTLHPWMDRHGDGRDGRGPRLVNMYGITETTVHVTFRQLGARDTRSAVGRPLTDLGVALLDRRGRPVPLGVAGEIHVAGAGLARGYLGRPALTATRFVADDVFGVPGDRLYRSGDLARWRPGGDLEFLGRLDHQVQLRGFRIELGEIEATLADHPAVEDVAVLPRGRGDSTRLVAYVVTGEDTEAAGLRDHAGHRLPDYMVPGAFVFLDALPLTANGKVDRRALAEMDAEAPPSAAGPRVLEPPRTPREEILAGLFAEVLERPRVGATESFFDLGGHSLLATRLVARARQALDVEIPLGALFEHPTVRELARAVESSTLPEEDAPPPLVPSPRGTPRPLSFSQERLWFLDRLEPGTPAYDISLRLWLEGPLGSRRLDQALTEVMRRHEALRTRFPESPETDAEAVQQIDAHRPTRFPVVDLGGLEASRRDAQAQRLAREAAFVSFDLSRGPLLSTALVRTSPACHLFLFTVHHIVADGWSLGVLSRELTRLYEAFAAGRPSPLPELPIQYGDYAAWQRSWLTGATLERHVEHWRERLAGVADLDLPTDRPRPPVQTFRGHRVPWKLSPETVGRLQTVARGHGATLFMVLAAAMRWVLGRWSGQRDFALGTFVANRTRAETQDLIGFFVNNLALRTPLDPARSFGDQVGRERETALAAYAHQQLPFETLLTKLDVPRDMSRSSLFQVMLVLQNTPRPDLDLPGVTVRGMAGKEGRAHFDLTLWTFDDTEDGSLRGAFEYATVLFDRATVARLAGHLTTVLDHAADEPGGRLEDSPLLTGGERAQLLHEWATPPSPPGARFISLPERIRRIAGKRPDAVALVAPHRTAPRDVHQVTYGALVRRAGELAGDLAALGVGRGDRVAIYDERTPETLAALLAVMDRGAAYIPLDAAYGRSRLAVVLEEAGVRVLGTRRRLLGDDDLPEGLQIVDLDRLPRSPDGASVPPAAVDPADAAYVIYTSGTTGRPKGVVVSHEGLAALYDAWHEAYDLPHLVCHLQTASLSFDVFAGDWVRALGSGAKLLLAPSELRLQPEALWDLIVREGVDAGEVVPAVMRPILDLVEARDEDLTPFRLLLVGSDAWYVEEMRRVARRLPPGARLVDSYGVTEATIDSTWFLFDGATAAALPAEALAPIGRPFPGCRAWVAAPDGGLCPVGVPGELCLGGPGLARGYLARPARTADRFVPDPFSGEPGERLYRTGDRARWHARGHLELLGRMDQQLKVRGFRIEPGEIEAALGEHPRVRQAVVAARGPSLGEERLVAYVIPGEPEPTGAELRTFLTERLPDYMVPAVYVPLGSFPLTPHGKVDRRALPAPDWGSAALGADYEPPRAGTETMLAGLYEDVLPAERVGAADGFFARGGHSLAATRLVSRIRRTFDVDLPLRAVFEEPTVRGLGRRIEALLGATRETAPPLQRAPRDEPLPLSFAQERLWFLDRLEPGRPTYHLFTALAVDGPLRAGRLATALQRLARRHETLRTTFSRDVGEADGEPRQHVAAHAVLPVPVVDLSALTEAHGDREAAALTRSEARRPFDLAAGPLLRLSLLRFGPRSHRALLTQHHVISDAWSMGIFWNELARLYDGDDELPPLPIQYGDFAVWQRRWLTGDALESQLAYWRGRLRDVPEALELPTDRPRPPVQSQRGRRLPVGIPARVTARLRAVSEARGATLYMTLLSAFVTLLHRLSGQDRLAVGTPVANRTRAELEGLLGFFVNTLVLDADFTEAPSFDGLLGRVRATALGAYAHQDLPFERLVEDLAPERDLSRTPLFQAVFAFQNAPPVPATRARDLALRPLPAGTGTAKFDLGLELVERGGELAGHLEYATDLFDRTTVERWSRYLGRLLEAASLHPETAVPELPWTSAAERHQLLREWQDTRPTAAPPSPLERIESWIETTPDAVVATAPGRALTWGELGRRAEALARRLGRWGVGSGPEDRVALRLEPSPETLVSIVATWKAGGTYVPLDPSHPAERVAACLEDAEPLVLLEGHPPEVRRLRRPPEPGPGGSRPSRDHLAYVVYTSGSTGRPKGVAVSHGALALLWADRSRLFHGTPEDRVALAGGPAFDIQLIEMGAAMVRGASLHAPGAPTRRSPDRLMRWLATEDITGLFLATPLAEALLQAPPPPSLQWLCAGGDRLRARPTSEHSYRLFNAYGPTEVTVVATTGQVSATTPRTSERRFPPAIGRPRRGVTAHVTDPYLTPVPLGVAGELVVGGGGLSRGYLHRPAATAASFVPDPFTEIPGSRLYRTGDRVRRRPDGRLDFLDRLDAQVQVRGFRVEPGEIEMALERHPAVGTAVVLAGSTPTGGVRLDACFEPRDGESSVTGDELRDFLRRHLPEPMVPATFTRLDQIPLTPNGKIDRKALRDHIVRARDTESTWDPTPTEEILAGLWRDVLELDGVGPEDDFFQLGGHSLAATRITARVRDALGVELPLQELFRHPTVRQLARWLDLRRAQAVGLDVEPVRPVPRRADRALPLSFSQERFWLLSRLDASGAAYNIPLAVALDGALSAASLAAALEELAARHEALHTVFRLDDDRGVQEILPASPPPLPRVDLTGLGDDVSEREAARLSRTVARRPFDLETGPVVRTALLRRTPTRHVFVLVLPHAAADEGAMDVLLTETLATYDHARRGEPSPLAPPGLQIADVAAWQRRRMAGETLDRLLAFWRSFLGDPPPPPLETPTDRPRPPRMGYAGAAQGAVLGAEASAAVRKLAEGSGTTLFVLLLAAFQATLFRWTGQSRFVVGTPVSQRDRTELEGVVGPLLNTLALPVAVGDDPSFRQLLERARSDFLAAWDHRDLPFERLLDDLDLPRDVSRPPLYQAMLVLQRSRKEPPAAAGLELRPAAGGTATSKLDLTLFARDDGRRLGWSLEYATALFDATSAKRFLELWKTLLHAAVITPDRRISELPLLPDSLRHQLVTEWCDTETPYPEDTLPGLLIRQAERTPDAVAVSSGHGSLSYRELRRRGGRLARRLRRRGIGPERPVAILLDRSVELMVALWGVLEAGAPYLPLSPDDPPRRLASLVAEARPAAVISGPPLSERLPEGVPRLAPLVSASTSPEPPLRAPSPEQLAYVIYTSGSTGRPKGVMVSHRAIVNRLSWGQAAHALHPADRVLQKTPVTFDVSVWELFWPLAVGARLVFARPGGHRDARYLADVVQEEGITLIHFVPSLLQIFAEEPAVSELRSLRHVVASGEALPPALVRRVLDRFPPRAAPRVHNLYGPTEAAVEVTAHRCTGTETGSVPLGRPVANTAIRIVDPHGRPASPGTPGELCIGGVQLARGYLHRPGLTAERFVPDPFPGPPGARLYRTGDLARWLPEGRVDYLGRLDTQVKVRGVRIELGEIEAALGEHPTVREAVVTAHGEAERRRLVAYLVPREEIDPAALRDDLAGRLPDAFVPSAFVVLEALPLTPSGKVDRKRLPEPEAPTSSDREPPEGPVEEVLAGMFAEILGVDDVGRGDSFFELGGQSLTAARLLAWVRESFETEISLARVFEEPTIAGLATDLTADPEERPRIERTAELLLELADMDEDELAAELEEEEA